MRRDGVFYYTKKLWWEDLPIEELLQLSLNELDLNLKHSWIYHEIQQVCAEAQQKGISVLPKFWISNEWFCPDGIYGIAIPFYLLHPRLLQLEKHFVKKVEGRSPHECRKLIRHEFGHAFENAFATRRKKLRQATFGHSHQKYPASYEYRRYSRSFVRHLGEGYAQSHPDEDFAETFAVWLDPKSAWRKKYQLWPALGKLQVVDQLIKDALRQGPVKIDKTEIAPLNRLQRTLRQYYKKRSARYSPHRIAFWDHKLRKIFKISKLPQLPPSKKPTADQFIKKNLHFFANTLSQQQAIPKYLAKNIVTDLSKRSRFLQMQLRSSERVTRAQLVATIFKETDHYLKSGQHRIPV